MADEIQIGVDITLTPIAISDHSGTKIGAAFINLQDVRIPARITEIIDFAKTIDIDNCDFETLRNFSDMMEDKFCKLFGYDCRRSLFGIISPVARCGNKFLYVLIVEQIMDKITAEIKEKAQKRDANIKKYTRGTK